MTCYYWPSQGLCKWSDDDCLYAHYNTGKLSSAPLQIQEGRAAVAGRNAFNPEPVYLNWHRELVKLSEDENYEIKYTGPLATNSRFSAILEKLGASDHRQKLVVSAETLFISVQTQMDKFKKPKDVKGKVVGRMIGISATSRLPQRWPQGTYGQALIHFPKPSS